MASRRPVCASGEAGAAIGGEPHTQSVADQSKTGHLPSNVAFAIRELRLRLGETQLQFAVRTRLGLASITRYETGAQQPKASILKALCAVAKSQKCPDLARMLDQALDNRVRPRHPIRTMREDAVRGRVRNTVLLIERSLKQTTEVLNQLESTQNDEHTPDFRGELERLMVALSQQRASITHLSDAIGRMMHGFSTPVNQASANRRVGIGV